MVAVFTFNSVSSWHVASSLAHLCLKRRKNFTPLRFCSQVLKGAWITLTRDVSKPLLKKLFANAPILFLWATDAYRISERYPPVQITWALYWSVLEQTSLKCSYYCCSQLHSMKLKYFQSYNVTKFSQVQFYLNNLFFSSHGIVSITQN